MMGIKVSNSKKDKYLNCPHSYHLHYNLKLREAEERSALKFGGVFDEALNDLLVNRNLNQAKKIFDDQWIKFKKAKLKYSKADLDIGFMDQEDKTKLENKSENIIGWTSMATKAHMMLEQYNIQILPKIKKVIKVQNYVSIKNELGDALIGYVDFIAEWEDGRTILFDNKTTSVKYKPDSVRTSEQLATYEEAVIEEGIPIDACGYITISKKIRKVKEPKVVIDVIIDEIPEELHDKTFEQYEKVLNGIKAGVFEKNWDGCMTKFGKCPYYDYCRNGSLDGLKYTNKDDK
jgi:hypothetical protein